MLPQTRIAGALITEMKPTAAATIERFDSKNKWRIASIHESAHALICLLYNGHVKEISLDLPRLRKVNRRLALKHDSLNANGNCQWGHVYHPFWRRMVHEASGMALTKFYADNGYDPSEFEMSIEMRTCCDVVAARREWEKDKLRVRIYASFENKPVRQLLDYYRQKTRRALIKHWPLVRMIANRLLKTGHVTSVQLSVVVERYGSEADIA